jgi:hypothetical protein
METWFLADVTMTEYEAVQANLMALVRITDDLQKQVQSLESVCRIQDASILALNDRIKDLESKVHTLEFPLEC